MSAGSETRIYGLILSGGKSSRMGVDKGTIRYQERPQREHLFDLLSAVCERVYTSCKPEQNIDPVLNPLPDNFDTDGPMNGILSAFNFYSGSAWLIVAIDLPNVSLQVLKYIISQRQTQKMATCFFDTKANAPEPLLTIWEPAAYPLLLKNVKEGKISPRYFLQTSDVKIIRDADQSIFLNINYPHERDTWLRPD